MAQYPAFVGTPNVGVAQIVAADTTTKKTVFTAGSSGSKLNSLMCASDDSSAENVDVWLVRSATNYLLGTVNIPITAGGAAGGNVAGIDLLGSTIMPGLPLDNDGQHYLPLKSGDTIAVSTRATVTAAKTLHFVATGGDL